MMARSLRNGLALCLGVALGGVATYSHAAMWPKATVKYSGGGTPVWADWFTPTTPTATGTGVQLNGLSKLYLGDTAANITGSRLLSWAGLARLARIGGAFASVLGVAWLVADLGVAGYQWLNGQWVKSTQADPMGANYWYGSPSYSCGTLQTASCTFAAAALDTCSGQMAGAFYNGRYRTDAPSYSETHVGIYCKRYVGSPDGDDFGGVVDMSGIPQPSGDPVPATDAEVETAIAISIENHPTLAPDLATSLIVQHAAEAEQLAQALGIAGPATVTGPSRVTTTQGPAGTETQAIQNTYNITYQGSEISIDRSVTSTTTNAGGVTTTTSTNEGGEPAPEKPPFDWCVEHPDASGCQPLGDVPEAVTLPEDSQAATFAPTMSGAGSCPAPVSLSIFNSTYNLAYDNICALATGVRPIVLALAWLSAFFFIFSASRKTS